MGTRDNGYIMLRLLKIQVQYHLVRLHCCCTWLEASHAKSYPCCSCSDLHPNHTRTPPAAIISFLGSLLVNCDRGCNRTVQARQYKHTLISSQCQDYFIQSTCSPSKTTAAAILQKDEAPVTATERKVARSVLKQIMMETDGNVIKVPIRTGIDFLITRSSCRGCSRISIQMSQWIPCKL